MSRIEKLNDQEYEEDVLSEVREHSDGWEITQRNGGTLSIPKVDGVTPKVGSLARYYGRGFGFPVRGVDIDGREAYYRSAAEERERHENWVADLHREKKAEATAAAPETERRINALPAEMQQRIQKFRNTNPDFDWEFLPYELFCCEEAVKVAAYVRTEAGSDPGADTLAKLVNDFHDDFDAQKGVIAADHSGNTFGMACRLARWLLTDPEMVVKDHGALVPLVGCEEYGCPHPAETSSLVHEHEGNPT